MDMTPGSKHNDEHDEAQKKVFRGYGFRPGGINMIFIPRKSWCAEFLSFHETQVFSYGSEFFLRFKKKLSSGKCSRYIWGIHGFGMLLCPTPRHTKPLFHPKGV